MWYSGCQKSALLTNKRQSPAYWDPWRAMASQMQEDQTEHRGLVGYTSTT